MSLEPVDRKSTIIFQIHIAVMTLLINCILIRCFCFDLGFQISNSVIEYRPDLSYMSCVVADCVQLRLAFLAGWDSNLQKTP